MICTLNAHQFVIFIILAPCIYMLRYKVGHGLMLILNCLLIGQALRNVDEDARLCYLLIHMLLLKPQDFKSRVQEFVKEVDLQWIYKMLTLDTQECTCTW